MNQENTWTTVTNKRCVRNHQYQTGWKQNSRPHYYKNHSTPNYRYFKHNRRRYNPITSYGIILFTLINNVPHYLISQRRDTIEYVDFIRGHYSRNYIQSFFALMSIEERERIENHTFDELWNDLWINKEHRIFRDAYQKARSRFESIKNQIPQILAETTSIVVEPPWGFPKGKKNVRETEIDCAIREFEEETRMDASLIKVGNHPPYIENYKGSNRKDYSTHYYLAYTPIPIEIKKIPTEGIRTETVSEEILNLKWVTFEKACEFINSRRQNLLQQIHTNIQP